MIDFNGVEKATSDLLEALGIERNEHTVDTPKRVARWWKEFIDFDSGTLDTKFPVHHSDEIVAVKNITIWSVCAHHLLPFSANVTIAYIANNEILGLSKFCRIAQVAAHKPTTQEQLVTDISEQVEMICGTSNLAVAATGFHLCMAMRGVKMPANMITSKTKGLFKTDPAIRSEWLQIAYGDAKTN